jgi:hypothetical protein
MGLFEVFHQKKVMPTPAPQSGCDSNEAKTNAQFLADAERQSGDTAIAQRVIDNLDVVAEQLFRTCALCGYLSTAPPSQHPLGYHPRASTPLVRDTNAEDEVVTGVCIRSKYGIVRSSPPDHPGFRGFEEGILVLNARAAIKMRSKTVDVAVRKHM